MLPLISIIVPIYKVESFLEKCIESLIKQSYENIEIILVDDGSPDKCGSIIDYYKNIDNRIIAIHKRNEGVSAARNAGLIESNGDYIMFVDGDDYVEPDYVEYFFSLIQDSCCEMAVGSEMFYNKNISQVDVVKEEVVDSTEIVKRIYLGYIGVAVWNKIYRKSLLDQYALTFNSEIWYAEGMLFNVTYLQYVEKVAVGNKRVYHAVENDNSATRLFSLDSQYCGLRSMEMQKEIWRRDDCDIKMAWEYHYRQYAESILRGLLDSELYFENKKLFRRCIHILKSNIRIPIQANIGLYRKNEAICKAIDPMIIICNINEYCQCNTTVQKIRLYIIKKYKKISYSKKAKTIRFFEKHWKKHYKPKYIKRKLL